MIYNFKYSNMDKTHVINYLKQQNFKRVIDVGASANSWSAECLTHYVDIKPWTGTKIKGFIGNICKYSTWEPIFEDVKQNGKYDFAICSHTLEDISSPQLVCEFLCKIANEGFIAVPSKNVELSRNVNGNYYGHVHHRWIYNKENDNFVAYPKLNFIEYVDWTKITENLHGYDELHFYWKKDFKLDIVNNDYMGPDVNSVYSYFNGLKNV